MGSEKNALLQQLGRAGAHLQAHFPQERNAGWDCSWPSLCYLRGGVGESCCPFTLSRASKLFVSLLQWYVGTSLWNRNFTNTLSFMGDPLRQWMPGAPGARPPGAEGSFLATEGFCMPRTEVCMPITWHTVGKTPLRFLSGWCWTPQVPKRHFCLWIDAPLLSLRAKQRMSYSPMRLMVLPKGYVVLLFFQIILLLFNYSCLHLPPHLLF